MLNDNLTQDLDALLPGRSSAAGATRRTALKAALGVGYAASVLPVMAQTAVKTPSTGLTTGEVMIDVNGFKMPAYRAAPEGKTGLPLAIAPELFIRQGDAQSYGEMAKLIAEVISQVPDAQVMGDLDATVAWAAANGGDTRKLGVTGFCWGGRQTWLYAAHHPAVKAGVAWYGRLEGQTSTLNPTHPIDVVNKLNGPVLGLYGGADTGIPLASVDKMKAALATGNAAAQASTFVVYPDAPHAFHADYRPSFRKDAAEDGWKRAVAWFKANGVA